MFSSSKATMVTREEALPGRAQPEAISDRHYVLGEALTALPAGQHEVFFGMGCFWGAEKAFWKLPGVTTTAVGYAGGYTPNPSYREVCTGRTGHTEAVRVVYDPARVAFGTLLKAFWEGHDPTTRNRQGNDVGTQYRSALFCTTPEQHAEALASAREYAQRLARAGFGSITTEIAHPAPAFYYADDDHQQYLAKNPAGYCGLGGTGVSCPIGVPL